MTKLLDDEVEEDEQFWNQEALKEVSSNIPLADDEALYVCCLSYIWYLQEEHDDEYEAEAEAADEFDSDFNDDVTSLLLACILIATYSSNCS